MSTVGGEAFEAFEALSRDLRETARTMDRFTVRSLLDLYYQIQDYRISTANRIRAISDRREPHRLLQWAFSNNRRFEANIKRAMAEFVKEYRVTQWLVSLTGVAEVIASGLLARLDIRKAKTAGQFWSYAGLNPEQVWRKGEKCPWNIKLHRLSFLIGSSFVNFSNHRDQYYGTFYRERKAFEIAKNERLEFRSQAEAMLAKKRFDRDTVAYKCYIKGKLPPGHIQSRCIRYVTKIFLSHVHHVMHVDYYGHEPTVPWIFTERAEERLAGVHRHFIPVPNWPFDGSRNARPLSELYAMDPPPRPINADPPRRRDGEETVPEDGGSFEDE